MYKLKLAPIERQKCHLKQKAVFIKKTMPSDFTSCYWISSVSVKRWIECLITALDLHQFEVSFIDIERLRKWDKRSKTLHFDNYDAFASKFQDDEKKQAERIVAGAICDTRKVLITYDIFGNITRICTDASDNSNQLDDIITSAIAHYNNLLKNK